MDVAKELRMVQDEQVVQAAAQVRALASSDAGNKAIMAALDSLVDVAIRVGHKDLSLYQGLRAQALHLKDQLSIPGLCLEVLSEKENDRLSSAVLKGLKEQKAKQEDEKKSVNETLPPQPFQWPYAQYNVPQVSGQQPFVQWPLFQPAAYNAQLPPQGAQTQSPFPPYSC